MKFDIFKLSIIEIEKWHMFRWNLSLGIEGPKFQVFFHVEILNFYVYESKQNESKQKNWCMLLYKL